MQDNRRPITSRSKRWAMKLATFLIKHDISPNQISVASIGFAAAAAASMAASASVFASLVAIAFIQLRLVCNLLDGMVAIEGGKQSALGSLYNEFPDRIADSLLIVTLGYAAAYPSLGWFAALAAALTAYVRVFGGALGLKQSFAGPMAKQHRMAVMTAGLALNIPESLLFSTHHSLFVALIIIAVGSVVTCAARTRIVAGQLKEAQ
ncbi:CDP-diacylglycerol--glycerol-3-phosphate 3-phosphatidyltransferase [Stutzerimonas stutzeri]|uniref:CDP-diacylglycerol--glycerol-3-phosphate 3-phosphatidyltransferase n=1 Tax=Stutzerimonas stutzeri TaxID=316 RepID=W8R2T5_STUST|nr:CDP-alcohol phosphatidyltransferase family protein [Stutzerimonas stutzeri]AHL73838.1 CDP-diacylglycerol--glycerol-3-phosphate 3-phosphatidyltransferase [Stutzerimonas stutzeri]MCQ4328643.1 CDP-alcohol phosphatidyltransferase family protein [Stutzerimonas stutzeri]